MATTPEQKGQFNPTSSRFWARAAVGCAVVGASGLYGWIQQGDGPLYQECFRLGSESRQLADILLQDGVLGEEQVTFNGSLVFTNRTLEIRRPSDPRVDTWGELKNRRDKACADAQLDDSKNMGLLAKSGAVFGIIGTLASLNAYRIRRQLK